MAAASPRRVLKECRPGDYLLVRHRGEQEFQERLLTFRSDADDRVVFLTPDEDHYIVKPHGEFEAIYALGPRGGLPRGVRKAGQLVYRFQHRYTEQEFARILEEG